MRIGVMQGDLADFDLATILQTVGLGRQYMGVKVGHENGVSGTIFVKSGKIVRIESSKGVGAEALAQLLRAAEGSFYVFRSETPKDLPVPLGAIDTLLMTAIDQSSIARGHGCPRYPPAPLWDQIFLLPWECAVPRAQNEAK